MSDKDTPSFDVSSIGEDTWLVVVNAPKGVELDEETCTVLSKRIKNANPSVEIVFLSHGLTIDGLGDDALAYLGLVRTDTQDQQNEFTLRSSVFKLLEEVGNLRNELGSIPDDVIEALLRSQVDVCEYADALMVVLEVWCAHLEDEALATIGKIVDTSEIRRCLNEASLIRSHIEIRNSTMISV